MPRKLIVLALVLSAMVSTMARAGAPRNGDRFVNLAGPRELPGFPEMLWFFLRKTWRSLLVPTGAAGRVPFDRQAMERNPSVTWIGHSTLLVRMDGVTFLTDPMFSERASPYSFAGPKRLVPPGVPLDQLPPVDFAILSHDHYDHTDVPSLAALARGGTRFIVPLGLGDVVRSAGGEAIELDWWQHTRLNGAEIHCVPAQHFSGRSVFGDQGRRLWSGWVVVGSTRRFYHAGDTGYFAGFAEIGRRFGPLDLAALPIGAYDPPSIMRFVHLDPEEAVHAAVDLRAERILAVHFGTFDLTEEPLDEPPRRFRRAATRNGFDRERAWTLKVGESREW
jgi:N-acyl-phosphatidylethanolamine-hydrolysing phospholipase D